MGFTVPESEVKSVVEAQTGPTDAQKLMLCQREKDCKEAACTQAPSLTLCGYAFRRRREGLEAPEGDD